MSFNYVVYTDNTGREWSLRMDNYIASALSATPVSGTPLPRLPGHIRSRRMRLAEALTGRELLVAAPYPWPFGLGSLVVFDLDVWYVTYWLDEEYRLEKG